MVRVRKLVLAIAAASALSSGVAHALGLGEVTLQSALNQPLVAEIELLEVRDLGSSEVLPSLATPEEFAKAGVDRQYFLTDLKFTPVLKPNGKSVIRVTSSKPVREPYLNFLVEVLWPNGRLLREYTLLLDPPLYSPQATVTAAPQLPAAAPVVPVAPRPVAPVAAPSVPVTAAMPSASRPDQYRTTANDTLWEIAQRVRGSGSVHQAMLAIQDLNPDAFVGGNINRLKSGQVLRLPEDQQIKSRSQSEAIAQVAAQNADWRAGRSPAARQLDATKRSVAGDAPAQVKTQDSLKLVTAEAGQASGGSERGAADSKALQDKLAVTQESLDSTRRENEELKGRMGDLQSQLDKLQRLIQLKDDQLAKLQAELAAQAQEPAPVAPEVTPASEPPAVASEAQPAAVPSEAAVQAPVEESPGETPVAPEAPATPDFNYSEEPAAPVTEPAAEPVVEAAPVPVEPAPVSEPVAAAPVVEEQDTPSPLDEMLANPMILGLAGTGAALLLLVGLMMLSRRNAQKEAELQASLAADTGEGDFEADMQMPADSFEGLEEDFSEAQAGAAPAQERVTAQTGDVLGEADIYIAYGRFNQAAELLQNAINDEPGRSDLRLKLMEVYAELGDREGFAREESELREIGGADAQVELLKSKYPAMLAAAGGFAAVAAAASESAEAESEAFSLDDLTLEEEPADVPELQETAGLDDEFDLSLDDLESELESDLQNAGNEASLADIDTLKLEDDLQLEVPDSPVAGKDDDLGFDLGLEESPSEDLDLGGALADFGLELGGETPAAAAEEDEFSLSLDEEPAAELSADEAMPDLSLDLPAEAADNEFDLSDEFDLSADSEVPVIEPDAQSFAEQLDEVTAELDQLSGSLEQPTEPEVPAQSFEAEPVAPAGLESEEDFDFLSGTDETATKLDLARAYIDMGDAEGARDILDEVIVEGTEGQQQEARELIAKLG